MNYKLLFPTYRNRYRFIQKALEKYGRFDRGLSLGTGEGDYDAMIAQYCNHLVACDINEADVAFAKALNGNVKNLEYRVENALELSFADNSFDLLVSVEVIEHVGQPARMVQEIARVLKPGGVAFITFPSQDFPFTYDPVNRLNKGQRKIAQGAYAFGHEYLIAPNDFRQWLQQNGLTILGEENLSGYLVGLLELYWTGWIQKAFKANSRNVSDQAEKPLQLRPTNKAPIFTFLTDAIIGTDRALFSNARHSVGKGFIIQKS
ncbi:MAG: class I SAM-dependent methyltransferase [Saprospiraceae bacterium]